MWTTFTLFFPQENIKNDFFRSNGLEKTLPKGVVVDLNRKERLHEVHIMARVTRTKSDRVQNMTSQTNLRVIISNFVFPLSVRLAL